MKRKITILCMMIVFVLSLGLLMTACNGGQTEKTQATAYGFTAGGSVSAATVKKDSGTASGYKVTFDEYYLFNNWGNTTVGEGAKVYHQKLMVGDQVWTLDVTGAAKGYYKNSAGTFAFDYLKDAKHTKWYVEQINAGNFWILSENGAKVDDSKVGSFNVAKLGESGVTLSKTQSVNKAYNGYWAGGAATAAETVWNKQIPGAICDFINTNGFAFTTADIAVIGKEIIIKDTVITGASVVSAKDYITVILTAYNLLID